MKAEAEKGEEHLMVGREGWVKNWKMKRERQMMFDVTIFLLQIYQPSKE